MYMVFFVYGIFVHMAIFEILWYGKKSSCIGSNILENENIFSAKFKILYNIEEKSKYSQKLDCYFKI